MLTVVHQGLSSSFEFTAKPHSERQSVRKYVRLRGLMYIHTCRSYVHTPCKRDRRTVESPTGTFIVLYILAELSDFGLLGSTVPQNGRFPALDADEPLCKI